MKVQLLFVNEIGKRWRRVNYISEIVVVVVVCAHVNCEIFLFPFSFFFFLFFFLDAKSKKQKESRAFVIDNGEDDDGDDDSSDDVKRIVIPVKIHTYKTRATRTRIKMQKQANTWANKF